MFSPALCLGIAGVLLLTFPDLIAANTPVRILVSCALLTVVGIFVATFFLVRRAVFSPVTSFGLTSVLAGVYYLTSGLGWYWYVEETHGSAVVVVGVVCVMCAVIMAAYLDGFLGQKQQKMIFICGGIGACIVAVTLDYPDLTTLITEGVLFMSLFLIRRTPSLGFLRNLRIAKELQKTDAVVMLEEEASVTETVSKSESSNVGYQGIKHPLVWRGYIVNPETMRNIKIGAKKYTDLLSEGYRPDFASGILVRES